MVTLIRLKLFTILLVFCSFATAPEYKIRVLLIGDSTTIGNTPREINPEGPHLEKMIELIALAEGLPALEVINTGKGGETAKRLLDSKWYNESIASVENVDFIFLRMGINDWFKYDDFNAEFPKQMKLLIDQLKIDHPDAEIILSTICRFMPHDECTQVNDQIKQIAKDENLKLFDLYTPYNNFLLENGMNSLNVRQTYLDKIPDQYHAILEPFTHWRKGWGNKPDGYVVRVNDISLDPLFGHIKGWYYDRHPNSTGYNLIAVETVKYLKEVMETND